MKLVGDLKKQVEKTNSKEEAKEVIENAGMLLTDDELDNVTGEAFEVAGINRHNICQCDNQIKGDISAISSEFCSCRNCGGLIPI